MANFVKFDVLELGVGCHFSVITMKHKTSTDAINIGRYVRPCTSGDVSWLNVRHSKPWFKSMRPSARASVHGACAALPHYFFLSLISLASVDSATWRAWRMHFIFSQNANAWCFWETFEDMYNPITALRDFAIRKIYEISVFN